MSDNEWRRLALQFDGHRMQAIGHLKAMLQNPQAHREAAEAFLSAGPLSGEEVLAERIKALATPAPTAPSDAARYEYLLDCDYQAARKYLPDLVEADYKAKLRRKHDAAMQSSSEMRD